MTFATIKIVRWPRSSRRCPLPACPCSNEKLTKRLYKVAKKAAASKLLKRGVKEVVKALRKADGAFKGCVWGRVWPPPSAALTPPRAPISRSLCIIAGDISPLDVISHLPVLCEDQTVRYVFVE